MEVLTELAAAVDHNFHIVAETVKDALEKLTPFLKKVELPDDFADRIREVQSAIRSALRKL